MHCTICRIYIYVCHTYSLLHLECHFLFLNLQSQSRWSLFNGTWQKGPRELDYWLRFEIQETTLQMQQAIHIHIMHIWYIHTWYLYMYIFIHKYVAKIFGCIALSTVYTYKYVIRTCICHAYVKFIHDIYIHRFGCNDIYKYRLRCNALSAVYEYTRAIYTYIHHTYVKCVLYIYVYIYVCIYIYI